MKSQTRINRLLTVLLLLCVLFVCMAGTAMAAEECAHVFADGQCTACGVTGCRIIDSPRERLIAILTASLVPCNGKFPTLIAALAAIFSG